ETWSARSSVPLPFGGGHVPFGGGHGRGGLGWVAPLSSQVQLAGHGLDVLVAPGLFLLVGDHPAVAGGGGHQVDVGADGDHLPAVEQRDPVGQCHGRGAVGDDQGGG